MNTNNEDSIYTGNHNSKVLVQHKYKKYCYKIITLGSHPCGYVMIPKSHILYDVGYSDVHINVHGGLTYAGIESDGNYWIGWDYAHAGDLYYSTYRELNGKRWSLKEIESHCRDVINQIIKIKKFQKKEYYFAIDEVEV